MAIVKNILKDLFLSNRGACIIPSFSDEKVPNKIALEYVNEFTDKLFELNGKEITSSWINDLAATTVPLARALDYRFDDIALSRGIEKEAALADAFEGISSAYFLIPVMLTNSANEKLLLAFYFLPPSFQFALSPMIHRRDAKNGSVFETSITDISTTQLNDMITEKATLTVLNPDAITVRYEKYDVNNTMVIEVLNKDREFSIDDIPPVELAIVTLPKGTAIGELTFETLETEFNIDKDLQDKLDLTPKVVSDSLH